MKIKQYGIIGLATLLLSTTCYSNNLVSRHYEFLPNKDTLLTNPFLWQLTMNCRLSTQTHDNNILHATMLKHSGSINGYALNEGDQVAVPAIDNFALNLNVAASAQVQINNHGSSIVTADCELQ